MTYSDEIQQVLQEYPKVISKEQFCKICHVSKRTALQLLQSGVIPNKCSGKKTRKFQIALSDVANFLKQREKNPGYGRKIKGNKYAIMSPNMLKRMHDIIEDWLQPYASYTNMVTCTIAPYFKQRHITLTGLQAVDIQTFYTCQLRRVSANTVIHYHAIIHKALKYAMKTDLIPSNPADKVERPKKERFKASFYDADEINQLFQAAKGTRLELPVMLAAFYGLRRSEVVGLKWDAIDFSNKTIAIRHTVTACNMDGKHVEIASDTTKTSSSMRTLPLVPDFQAMLLSLRDKQAENRVVCGRSYCKEYLEYVCVDEMGNRIKPSYISSAFPALLKRNGLRVIRFHDLRHSCASLLLKNGVPMKQIQEWLGHSDFSTTANIYAHLDYQSKLLSAEAMVRGLGMKLKNDTEQEIG